jgi:pimeloyl-ACP methyl ester carboxylesterase
MARPILVLLHGANGCGREMEPLARALREHGPLAPDLLGHGGRPVPERLRFEDMVEDLGSWLAARQFGPVHLLGYSFGASVALGLAARDPARVLSVTAIAMVYRWTPEMVGHVVHLTDPARLARPGNPRLQQMHIAHGEAQWRRVTQNNRRLFAGFETRPPLTDEMLRQLTAPVLILTGEIDPLVPAEEARRVARALPNARLGLWPGEAHPLEAVPLTEVKYALRRFIAEVGDGSFRPGPPLRLERGLTQGGLAAGDLNFQVVPRR